MIHLSGFEVRDQENFDGDIEILFTGLRPGEKLYEELLIDEHDLPTDHPMIMRARERKLAWVELDRHLGQLTRLAAEQDRPGIVELLASVVSGYRFSGELGSWAWQRSGPSPDPVPVSVQLGK
jgi:FlaA1/EpsC-like NDP-sugar epimerase